MPHKGSYHALSSVSSGQPAEAEPLYRRALAIYEKSFGTVVSTHDTIRAAFEANAAFQKRMRESGLKDHVPTKIVTLKVRLGDGEHVNPGVHLFQEREKSGQG